MKGFSASGAWICHTGKIRKVNEDACLFGGTFSGASASAPMKVKMSDPQWIIAVADGKQDWREIEFLATMKSSFELTTEQMDVAMKTAAQFPAVALGGEAPS